MYENKTYETILADMLLNTRDDVDKREGSIVHDMLAPVAIEESLLYTELDAVLALGFADTSEGEWLDKRAAELGVERKPALNAEGFVTFSGMIGALVPSGTRVVTESGAYFVTTRDATFPSTGTMQVPAEAEEGGEAGNIAVGEIVALDQDVNGVASVTNEAPFEGGIDEESDASLLSRYLDRVRRPATSGNVYHYEQWAKEVPGVGDVKVYPIHAGPGTVKVVLLGDDKKPPMPAVVEAATEHIEAERPIGATVTVVGATEVPVNVTADLTLASGADIATVQAAIEAGIAEYLATLAFNDSLVRYTRIAAVLLDSADIIDYANLTVNGGVANTEVADGEVAVAGEVTLNAIG